MDKTAKIILIAGLVAIVVIGTAAFFAGRGTAGTNYATTIKDLKGVIADGNRTTGLIIEAYKREAGYVDTLESNNGKIIERLDKLQISLDERNRSIDDGFTQQLEYIKSLANIDERTGATVDGLGGSLEESLRFIDRAIETVQEGHP